MQLDWQDIDDYTIMKDIIEQFSILKNKEQND